MTDAEINEGRYGISNLPYEVRQWLLTEATKLAGWTSVTEIGNGSTMMMEWITFAITKDDWLKEIHSNLGKPLPNELQTKLINF